MDETRGLRCSKASSLSSSMNVLCLRLALRRFFLRVDSVESPLMATKKVASGSARSALSMTVVESSDYHAAQPSTAVTSPDLTPEAMHPALPFRQRAYTFFVCFAVAIGTGILSLPVKLYNAGFAPFVLLFTSTLVAEIAITWLTIDLLQRADLCKEQQRSIVEEIELTELDKKDNPDIGGSSTSLAKPVSPTASSTKGLSTSPSFYKLGEVFLSPFWQRIFSFCVVAKYTSILIGYALAGSKGACQLADCNPTDAIVPFILFFTGVVLLLFHLVQPIITTIVSLRIHFSVYSNTATPTRRLPSVRCY